MRSPRCKAVCLFIIIIFSSSSFFVESKEIDTIDNIILEIEGTKDNFLLIDQLMGEVYVKYWTHIIDSFQIKNDYILLHEDEMGDIIYFDKCWSDIDINTLNISSYTFDDITYPDSSVKWMKKVVFLDPDDCQGFYSFETTQEYPIVCLEVRYINGTTILLDTEAKRIGIGVPAPTQGFSLTGYCEDYSPDCWIAWRQNADLWYQNWVDTTTSISLPTPQIISSYIEDQSTTLFYELAHGASTYFQADQPGIYYTSSDVEDAMENREKMRFAFIGSCEGMTNTGEGTFSNAFRKGEMIETATIGYSGMGSCPGWSVSLEWQDAMFYAMDSGFTIKEAFDYANGQYPTIADCVVFVGDETLHIQQDSPDNDDIDVIPPNILITTPSSNDHVAGTLIIAGVAKDIDGMVDHVYVKIDDQDWDLASGINQWRYQFDTTTLSNGIHEIQAIAVDDDGIQSGSYRVTINVSNGELTLTTTMPYSAIVKETSQFFAYASGGIPPYQFLWDFGDGTGSYDQHPTHSYATSGVYEITVTLVDESNTTRVKTHQLSVKENDSIPPEIIITHPQTGFYLNNRQFLNMNRCLIIGPINVTINAFDNEGRITRIIWYLNEYKVPMNIQITNTWTWDTQYFGPFTITVKAVDESGNIGQTSLEGYKFF